MKTLPVINGRSGGFSLIEVLVAMFVLSIGAASVLSFFAAAASTHKRSVDRTHAALVAERVFSEVRGRYVAGKNADELTEELEKELPESWGAYRAEVYCFHPADTRVRRKPGEDRPAAGDGVQWQEEELFVRGIIRWKQKANSRAESFHTLMLPRNTRGKKRR